VKQDRDPGQEVVHAISGMGEGQEQSPGYQRVAYGTE
jgi:hypothetical protein